MHADVDRHSVNGEVTGFDVGKGAVRARIYNKSVEMKKSKQEWYPALLAARNGDRFDVALDLWRLEFQLRREGVKGFRLYAKPEMSDPDEVIDAELDAEDLPHIHSVRKALHWAGRLFAYLTRRWLRLVVPTEDPNRGRWPEHPTWAALRDGFQKVAMRGAPELPEDARELVRAARYSGYRRLLDRMAVGLLSTEQLMDTDPGAALATWAAYMHRIAGRSPPSAEAAREALATAPGGGATHRQPAAADAGPLARHGRTTRRAGAHEEAGATPGDGARRLRRGGRGATAAAPRGGRLFGRRPASLQPGRVGSSWHCARAASDVCSTRSGPRYIKLVRSG